MTYQYMRQFTTREYIRSNQLRKDIILIAGAVILNGVLLSMF